MIGKPAHWRLDLVLGMLNESYGMGDVSGMKKLVAIRGGLFAQTLSKRHKARFDKIERAITVMTDFEAKHGQGSCLNLDHPYVQACCRGESTGFSVVELENARRARRATTGTTNLFRNRQTRHLS